MDDINMNKVKKLSNKIGQNFVYLIVILYIEKQK